MSKTQVTVGPKMLELNQIAQSAQQIVCIITVHLDGRTWEALVRMNMYHYGSSARMQVVRTIYQPGRDPWRDSVCPGLADVDSFSNAMIDIVKCLGTGDWQADKTSVKSSKSSLAGKQLKQLLLKAWQEAFALDVPTEPLRSQTCSGETWMETKPLS